MKKIGNTYLIEEEDVRNMTPKQVSSHFNYIISHPESIPDLEEREILQESREKASAVNNETSQNREKLRQLRTYLETNKQPFLEALIAGEIIATQNPFLK